MKKMTLAALIAVLGLMAGDAFAWGSRRCYRGCAKQECSPCARPACEDRCAKPACAPKCRPACPPKDCETFCFPHCGGEVTSSFTESGSPCCVKRYVCERQFPANVHITTHKAFTCPTECETLPGGYQPVQEWREITGAGAELTGAHNAGDHMDY